jgi:hypothetical protein
MSGINMSVESRRYTLMFTDALGAMVMRKRQNMNGSVAQIRIIQLKDPDFYKEDESVDTVLEAVKERTIHLKNHLMFDYIVFLTGTHHYAVDNDIIARDTRKRIQDCADEILKVLGYSARVTFVFPSDVKDGCGGELLSNGLRTVGVSSIVLPYSRSDMVHCRPWRQYCAALVHQFQTYLFFGTDVFIDDVAESMQHYVKYNLYYLLQRTSGHIDADLEISEALEEKPSAGLKQIVELISGLSLDDKCQHRDPKFDKTLVKLLDNLAIMKLSPESPTNDYLFDITDEETEELLK